MDRRQLLDGIASMSLIGDLADDVVLACAAVRRDGHAEGTSAKALERGLLIVRALGQFERPLTAPESVSAMSQVELFNDAVEMITLSIPGPREEYFAELANDVSSVLEGEVSADRLGRIDEFFAKVAIGSLRTADSLLRPRTRDLEWTSTAPAF